MQASVFSPKRGQRRLAIPMPTLEINPALHKRVLIADDDSLVRGSLAAVLESEGFMVEEAEKWHHSRHPRH